MPWEKRTAMDQRKEFIEEYQLEQEALAELCRKYGVSRQTGYKWVKRFEAEGEAGLEGGRSGALAIASRWRTAAVRITGHAPISRVGSFAAKQNIGTG